MRGIRVSVVVRALLLLAAACSDDHVTMQDVGTACVFTEAFGSPQSYEIGAGASVHVTIGGCSSCDQDKQAWCTSQRDGDRVRIVATATWIPHEGLCNREACGLYATCEVEPLQAGTYQVLFDEDAAELAIPSTRETPICLYSR